MVAKRRGALLLRHKASVFMCLRERTLHEAQMSADAEIGSAVAHATQSTSGLPPRCSVTATRNTSRSGIAPASSC